VLDDNWVGEIVIKRLVWFVGDVFFILFLFLFFFFLEGGYL
jgi:hypothetical protein